MEQKGTLFSNSTKLGFGKIATIYIGSVLLSPFSLYWFFKYRKDLENKKVAYISLVLTLITLLFGIVTMSAYIKAVNGYMSDYKNNLDIYSQLY